jgi:hypothetical protein
MTKEYWRIAHKSPEAQTKKPPSICITYRKLCDKKQQVPSFMPWNFLARHIFNGLTLEI